MGVTHALSVLAAALMFIGFAPDVVDDLLRTNNTAVIVLFVLTVIGSGLVPDLDNTSSRAKSDLGIFGSILSSVFRTSSSIAQTVIRTRRDDPTPNPHRGLWHTPLMALVTGGIILALTQIGGKISLPFLNVSTWGGVIAVCVSFVLVHLTLSSLAKKVMDKVRKSNAVGEGVAFLISLLITLVIFHFVPTQVNYWWLAVSVTAGMIIHDIGDSFTVAGDPLFFPLSRFIHGKYWWTTSFLPIKAGGAFENYVFIPVFGLLSLIGLGRIILPGIIH